MRRVLAITAVTLLVAALFAGTALAATKTIGVTLLTREHQFYRDLEAGMREAARQLGFELIIVSGEFDLARQAAQIEDFISRKVDAIVVCPVDSRGIGSSIVEANKAGIPVFTADIANLSGQGKVVSHIASDNVEGGRQAARLMVEALQKAGKKEAKIVIINHPGITSVLDRVKGFREVMAQYPQYRILADVPGWGQRDKAMAVMEDILVRLPDVDGVFGINDDSALGALAAIEAAGKAGQIIIVGYDATPEAKAAVEAGKIYGDAIQYPDKIGRLTIETIGRYFRGEQVPEVIPVEVGQYKKGSK